MATGITDLAATISRNTLLISQSLDRAGLPQPSFAKDGLPVFPVDALPEDISNARVDALNKLEELRALLLGPLEYITSFQHNELLSSHAIARCQLASHVPMDGEASFAEIAAKAKLDEDDTRRLLRHAVLKRIFIEPRKGYIAHNAVSKLLADNDKLLAWTGSNSDDLWQAATCTVDAMLKWPGSQEPNQTGFNLSRNTDVSIYQYFGEHPERAKRFGDAMTLYSESPAFNTKYMVEGYNWAGLQADAQVVDIGGSHGAVARAVVSTHPKLHFVVQDMQSVVDSAPELAGEESKRIKFMKYDFMAEEQPVKAADAYFFRWILHNWSDKYAIKILRNLIPALKPGARIVVADNILPEPGSLGAFLESRALAMDLTMKEMQNAKERDLDEWKDLFQKADPRFVWNGMKHPKGSMLSMFEIVWQA